MKLKAIARLIFTGGMISHSALSGTTSATLTVDSIVTMGPCTAQLLDSNDKEISQVSMGDVY
ncbi:fimbrial protein, partial [Escherichia coli]